MNSRRGGGGEVKLGERARGGELDERRGLTWDLLTLSMRVARRCGWCGSRNGAVGSRKGGEGKKEVQNGAWKLQKTLTYTG